MGHPHQQHGPSVYGRYETLFRIAAGGMAEVYAARVRGEAGFQKLVALKRMLPHLTDDERFVSMFMDEGKLAANISSPNVVSTLDLGRADDGSLYLVMELVVGTTLSGLLRNAAKAGDSAPVDVAVEMLAQAAQGLHDAHEAKTPFGAPLQIVHRDISPQNILIGSDGRVRITDFGVARAILRRTKTSTGEFKGKLSYFSPEQCADKNLDRRSDIFSLGVVAWETLTTRRLFHAENPLAVLERVTRMPIPLAHTVRPDVPPAVSAVVAKALERDRDQRFNTSAELATALRDALRDTGGSADRHQVSELVQRYGGESLARVQKQLKISLSNPGTLSSIDAVDDAKTELSSGIVFREGDGPPVPATPKAPPAPPAAPSFVGDPLAQAQLAQAQPAPTSRLPLVIASLVAVIGLGAGAAIGVIATTSGDAPEVTESLPEIEVTPTTTVDESEAAAVVEPPEAALDTDDEGDDAAEDPVEATPPSAAPTRGRAGRARRRGAAPRPAPVQEAPPPRPAPAQEAPPPRVEPPPRPTPPPADEPVVEAAPRPRPGRRPPQAAPPAEEPEPAPPPQRPGGLVNRGTFLDGIRR